jgi:hypothetical protein
LEPHRQRTFEVFNLFNPAFCGLVLMTVIDAYEDELKKAFPFSVSYLILPILLTKDLRETLPPTARQPMHAWIQKNPKVRIGFPERCRDLLNISHEAVTFLLQTKNLDLASDGCLTVSKKIHIRSIKASDEMKEILKRASLLGKWLASCGSPSTIFTIWGVRP